MNSFSINLDKTGVTEISLESWHVLGCGTFGTGVIELDFHLDKTMSNDTIVTKNISPAGFFINIQSCIAINLL